MNDKEELARDLSNFLGQALARAYDDPAIVTIEEPVAAALIAAGWRKKPSREAIAGVLEESDPEGGSVPDEGEREFSFWYDQADAILALMDGPTETGDQQ